MIFSFGHDLPQYTIEIYVGDALVNQQTLPAITLEILAMQFTQLCEQIANKNQPMKCVCKGTKEIELPNSDWVERPARVEFYNKKWDGEIK
jgi:hypothetical protein